MRVSDYILDFLVSQGVDTVFGITGGFITPLFDAFHNRTDIRYITTQHEQAAAMAADGYARFKGLGVAIATSGPGATNLITGIACSYFDSIPVLCITGQVPTSEARGKSGVRQRGFQETDIVSMVRPITKFAQQVNDPTRIAFELDYAVYKAKSGRPGPVLLDIPMDVLQADVGPGVAYRYIAPEYAPLDISAEVAKTVQLIAEAKRPVIIYGQGCRKYATELQEFIEITGIPCLPSWAALDLIPHDHPLFISQFGVYGNRAGNYAVQNADLVIAIGTRLDTRMTGKGFAPKAKLIVVDLDPYEAEKNNPDETIIVDAGEFFKAIIPLMKG
jgi:acetolactate synthase-1/2/3 large subunit